ncbi:thioredoxin-like protein [Cotia virus SPAn232]|uniref:Thioredoxin-like protein n=2 Tax=Cotia virus TaxID=39444 RepID=H6TA82_9POXV|nr:thioredoxin-like protein [Cotia virus SPAn232]ADT91122.1 thioredoxin-like protein [Cotia virus SPAn232]AIT70725.1 thioredoxin-like protein [Cotia virus]
MKWYEKYRVELEPPKRCSKCLANLFDYVSQDTDTIRLVLETEENKLNVLKKFLSVFGNKEFLYKKLDSEVRRVLT